MILLQADIGNEAVKVQKYVTKAIDSVVTFLPSVIGAILILWLGFKISKKIINFVDQLLSKSTLSVSIRPFIMSVLKVGLNLTILLAAAGVAGIDLSLFVTIIGASVLAIGLSLQDFLGNLASGLLILTIKPFKVGDWIDVRGTRFGKVSEIGVFNTTVVTPGNKTLIIPNSILSGDVITNYSERGLIRLEIAIYIPYSESFPRVKVLIEEALKTIPNILETPKTEIGIVSFDSHSVQLIVRPYVIPDDFWEVTFASYAKIKSVFHDNDIQVAYPENMKLGSIGK